MPPLEDPNDPNVLARGHRLRDAYEQFMHAAYAHHSGARFGGGTQVKIAQNEYLFTSGANQMASNYSPSESRDVVTVDYLQDILERLVGD